MGVNNISHYNYSHTATPIHHQPSSTPSFTFPPPCFFHLSLLAVFFSPSATWLHLSLHSLPLIDFVFPSLVGKVHFLFSVPVSKFTSFSQALHVEVECGVVWLLLLHGRNTRPAKKKGREEKYYRERLHVSVWFSVFVWTQRQQPRLILILANLLRFSLQTMRRIRSLAR